MPWFPEFSTAIELARRDARAREQADPVAQYLKALYDGAPGALEKTWPGDVVVHDPRAGEVRGHRALRAFIHSNREWMAAHHARLKVVGSITVGGRAAVELLVHVLHEGNEVAWPVAVIAESVDERSVEFRTYCSQWPVDGLRHLRPPILEVTAVDTTDVVKRHLDALTDGDVESIVKTFESDGYLQEPMDNIHRGAAELRAFYTGPGGFAVQPCVVTDDGVGCALEYTIDGPPQAGLAVFERGRDGLLGAVRLYDDITR